MSTIHILAFDPGTANMGYVTLIGNTASKEIQIGNYFGVLKTHKWKDGVEIPVRDRIDMLGANVRTLIATVNPTDIAMEDFVEQGKFVGKTYKEMAYITEHLRLLTAELNVPAAIYANGFWKKELLHASRASKLQVQHYIKHRMPKAEELLEKQPDHVWDSIGIGLCKWEEILKLRKC